MEDHDGVGVIELGLVGVMGQAELALEFCLADSDFLKAIWIPANL